FRAQCFQEVFVEPLALKNIVFPDDYVVEYDDDCSIFDDVSPELTGYPGGVFCPNINFYYNDIEYDQCGAQRKLLRDWFIIDWCSGESVTRGQIIKIIDNRSPVVECPADTVWYPQDWYNCITDVELDPYGLLSDLTAIKVIDECSEPLSVTVEYLTETAGHGLPQVGIWYPVPISEDSLFVIPDIEDDIVVRYCYSDDCGNRSTLTEEMPELIDSIHTSACCEFVVNVEDMTAPNAICEGYTKVQLTSTGITEVFAETFDDGSFDFCGEISYFEVQRENSSCPGYNESGLYDWNPSVHFCCEDLGETLTIRLRAYDKKDNFSECLGVVTVHNYATPQIECPADVTLDCGDDYTDRDLIGVPTGENGCDSGIHFGDDWFNIEDFDLACNTGTIIRTVDVIDTDGSTLTTCEQRIFIDPNQNNEILEPGDFEFPVDVTIDECAFGPNTYPDFTGKPIPTKPFDCSNIAVSYHDDAPIANYQDGVCYTILRRWKVVDWCRYKPNFPGQHELTHVQEINISNSAVAEFSCPADLTVNTSNPTCDAYVNLAVGVSNTCQATFEVRWEIDAFNNGTIDFSGNGNDASDIYPAGEHKITYFAQNYCGGASNYCTFYFTIKSDKAPIPICRSELVWTINSNQSTVVWASDFDLKSIGGCNSADLLNFSFVSPDNTSYPQPSRAFDCSDIPDGISERIDIEVFVVDESGSFASCEVVLNLQDNHDHCTDQGGMTVVGGEIMTPMSDPIEEVMVELKDMEGLSSEMQMTGQNGNYAFESVMTTGIYEIAPYSNDEPLNGVSTLDLLLIQKHILGQDLLDSPYKMIAADIDANGAISAIDLIQLRKLILGIFEEFPENDSWVFMPENYEFVDPLAPWDYPGSLPLYEMDEMNMSADFVGVKVGDVNNSLVMDSGMNSGVNQKSNTTYLTTENSKFRKGDLVAVPIQIGKNIDALGIQFTLQFDEYSLLFEGIDRGVIDLSQEHFALLNSKKGIITISYDDTEGWSMRENDILFTAYFEAKADGSLADVLELNSSLADAELYTTDWTTQPLTMVMSESLNDVSEKFEVFQNEPNPFAETTNVAFSNPQRQMVSIKIFDASARLVYKDSKVFEKGINAFTIDAAELNAQGVLFYRVESPTDIVTRKMIVVK
ncbi:MAG: T9SS type A sorting domain-containing protein, partial [Saprospiraceae bacterium]|nr:T9SS type A sorting domain-containing protein [Saprospiraceae bacterium]